MSPLLTLLEALCDGSLTTDQQSQLERLVLQDRDARKLYIEYMHLHLSLIHI